MKNIILVVASVLSFGLSGGLHAQKAPPALAIRHLTGDYYTYITCRPLGGHPFPSNNMYVVTTAGIVLFDTPWDTTQFQPLLDELENRHHKKVVLCIATHYHDDRTAGLEYFASKGIKTYSSKQTLDLCLEHGEKQAANCFVNDTTFVCGNHRFETYYPGEGHTKDNIVIWCGDARILYGGCLVRSCQVRGLGNTTDSNVPQWAGSIRNVQVKYPHAKYVIPGHMHRGGKRLLKHTLKQISNYNT